MPVIDLAAYVDGERLPDVKDVPELFALKRARGGMAWLGLYRPGEEEMQSVAEEFNLHPLAVEDAVHAHQRPKTERYGDTRFTVLRPARYDDAREEVVFSELHIFTGPDFVVTVRHAATEGLGVARKRLESDPKLLSIGPDAVLYAYLDQVVDEYGPVVAGLENDIDEIEDELFSGDQAVARRIYELSREVIQFQRATHPLLEILRQVTARSEPGKPSADAESVEETPAHELQRGLRDVQDHVTRIVERVDEFRSLLQNALTVNSTLIGERQNEEAKKISAWAAIFFAPTVIAGIYGMNFARMPELGWVFGYPFSLALMVGFAFFLRWIFKRRRWM